METKFKTFFALAALVATATFTSCDNNDDDAPSVPTQKEIETKIIGKWERAKQDGVELLTNERGVFTFFSGGQGTATTSQYSKQLNQWIWSNRGQMSYSISGNILQQIYAATGVTNVFTVESIDEKNFSTLIIKRIINGKEIPLTGNAQFAKVTADYSQDIIGLWEGVEMTGYETYGDASHRIEYKADGTYIYYKKDGDKWVSNNDRFCEYNVDGDWLATRWQNEGSDVTNYEWWDIDYIKNGEMKWSALREKEDGTRFNTTFTWKKVK